MDYAIALSRRQRKRQAMHQRILDVARLLFKEHGVGGTTVEDIAEAADVARQTVFNHFPYKEAVAVEIASEGIECVAHRARALLESGASALEVLERTAEWVFDSALGDGELAVVVARELLHPDPNRAKYAAQSVPLREIFEAILVQAREEDAVRSDLPAEIIASRVAVVLRSITAEILVRDPEQLRRELRICFDIFFHGIMKGRNNDVILDEHASDGPPIVERHSAL